MVELDDLIKSVVSIGRQRLRLRDAIVYIENESYVMSYNVTKDDKEIKSYLWHVM